MESTLLLANDTSQSTIFTLTSYTIPSDISVTQTHRIDSAFHLLLRDRMTIAKTVASIDAHTATPAQSSAQAAAPQ